MRRRVYMIHIVGKYKGSEGEGVAIMEFRMGGGDTKLICNTLWVKWTWLQPARQFKKICTTKKVNGLASVSDLVGTVAMQMKTIITPFN